MNPCTALLDFFLPHGCPVCHSFGQTPGICSACWQALCFLSHPCCHQCGAPQPVFLQHQALCTPCKARGPHALQQHRSLLAYTDITRQLIFALKHGGKRYLAKLLGTCMLRVIEDFSPVDLLISVPLHRRRLLHRCFNQSAIMASVLGQKAGIPADAFLLQRWRHTPSQGAMKGPQERRHNVAQAFKVPPQEKSRVVGKRVVIIDDVYTTGSTLEACAGCLQEAGAAFVGAITVAMVVPKTR